MNDRSIGSTINDDDDEDEDENMIIRSQQPQPAQYATPTTTTSLGLRHRRPRQWDGTTISTSTTSTTTTPGPSSSTVDFTNRHHISTNININNTDRDDVVVIEEEEATPATAQQQPPPQQQLVTPNVVVVDDNDNATNNRTNTNNNNADTVPPLPLSLSPPLPLPPPATTTTSSSWISSKPAWNKLSRYYCWMSTLGAILAIIVVAKSPSPTITNGNAMSSGVINTTISSSSSSSSGSSSSTSPTSLTLSSVSSSSTSNNIPKSIQEDDNHHPICKLSSSSSSDTTTSTTFGISNRANTISLSATTTATTDIPHDHSSSSNDNGANDSHDSHWWFRFWSPQPRNQEANNGDHLPSSTTTNSKARNSQQQQQPINQPDHSIGDQKNFLQSWLDTILMKGTNGDDVDKTTTTENKRNPAVSNNRPPVSTTTTNHPRRLDQKETNSTQASSSSSSIVSSFFQALLFSWLDPNLMMPFHNDDDSEPGNNGPVDTTIGKSSSSSRSTFPFDTIITNLIDKILTSTIRLILIANWLIALTVLLHTAVADYFLGNNNNSATTTGVHHNRNTTTATGTTNTTTTGTISNPRTTTNGSASNSTSASLAGRERMGGYLLFKFLLISAMVGPDTFDLLILLSWYTVLSFLRSLASLCIQQVDTCRLLLRSVPQVGVLQLLCTVLCLDVMAAITCIGLFHGAGYGMVILLTCDCVLLAFDTISHVIQYYQSIVDVQHANHIQEIDEQQMALHYLLQQERQHQENEQQQSAPVDVAVASTTVFDDASITMPESTNALNNAAGDENSTRSDSHRTIEDRSRELDQQMEVFEQQHHRTTTMIETMIFVLQLMIDVLTILHFVHIWTLHGIHFTFIDGVIALHLHSSATSALKKVHDRRATYRIARDMDDIFDNATEHDLQKAYLAGDVCCICLGTMHYIPTKKSTTNATGSNSNNSGDTNHKKKDRTKCQNHCNVKKVACGHLYHTTCLREVIERARSIEAARCPLCRSPFVPPKEQRNTATTSQPPLARGDAILQQEPTHETRRQADLATADNGVVLDAAAGGGGGAATQIVVGAEDSIFRFTTEGLLPDWIPLPGFSFEIVRRPPPSPTTAAAPAGAEAAINGDDGTHPGTAVETDGQNGQPARDRLNAQQQIPPQPPVAEQSLFRRIMLLSGIVQMSPEEEVIALEQLIDMFPQYERQDLQRALRQRGTIDAVVESILLREMTGGNGGGGGIQ